MVFFPKDIFDQTDSGSDPGKKIREIKEFISDRQIVDLWQLLINCKFCGDEDQNTREGNDNSIREFLRRNKKQTK
jgi:hypothetical protein